MRGQPQECPPVAIATLRQELRNYGRTDHEYRNASVVEDGVRYAAQEKTGRGRAPSRTHHDQVGVLRVGELEDGLCGVILQELPRTSETPRFSAA